MSPAILLALPGSSTPEAAATFRRLDQRIARRFEGVRRLWTYTSAGVRRNLAQRGDRVASPAQTFAKLRQDGITRVVVKALHLACGMEYTELCREIETARRDFEQISLSSPLLETGADFERMMRCLLDAIPAGKSAEDEALLLVAHGSRAAAAQAAYVSVAALCKAMDRRILFAVMLTTPGLAEIVRTCKSEGIRAVRMVPLMVAAGMSARTELAGDGPQSWKSVLENHGVRCTPRLIGLGDDDGIADIWIDDIGQMLAGIERGRGAEGIG